MRDKVISMVDRRISKSMVEGVSMLCIKKDLENRSFNFRKSINKETPQYDIDDLIRTGGWEDLKEVRFKYMIFYTGHAEKRISDIDWILNNKSKSQFSRLSNSQIFSLIKLKEKIQFDIEVPFR